MSYWYVTARLQKSYRIEAPDAESAIAQVQDKELVDEIIIKASEYPVKNAIEIESEIATDPSEKLSALRPVVFVDIEAAETEDKNEEED
jgi:hypothetical protein